MTASVFSVCIDFPFIDRDGFWLVTSRKIRGARGPPALITALPFNKLVRSSQLISPRPALRTPEPLVRLRVVDKLLLVRIPIQFASQPDRNHAEMANRYRPMPDFNVANRRFSRAYAI